jgi:hypothetical protein
VRCRLQISTPGPLRRPAHGGAASTATGFQSGQRGTAGPISKIKENGRPASPDLCCPRRLPPCTGHDPGARPRLDHLINAGGGRLVRPTGHVPDRGRGALTGAMLAETRHDPCPSPLKSHTRAHVRTLWGSTSRPVSVRRSWVLAPGPRKSTPRIIMSASIMAPPAGAGRPNKVGARPTRAHANPSPVCGKSWPSQGRPRPTANSLAGVVRTAS